MPATARVDVGALAGAMVLEVSGRVATMIARTTNSLRENGRALNQLQEVELLQCAFEEFATIEATFAKTIIDTLERGGVETWGLNNELEHILGGKS